MFLILYNNIVVIIIIFFTVLSEIYIYTLKCVYKSILDVIYSHYYF